MGESEQPPRRRLDPERAAADRAARRAEGEASGAPAASPSAPRGRQPADPARRARWFIGALGLLLVLAASVHQLSGTRGGSPGIPRGERLRAFVAPLATGMLNGDANVHPRCDPRRPDRQALNVCDRQAVVLAFFVPRSGQCVQAVDAEQTVAGQLSGSGITFAAVAVSSSRREVRRLVQAHRWRLPVAVDPGGAVGQLYGVVICPLFELATAGGRVQARLIGDRWTQPAALARAAAALQRAQASGGGGARPPAGRTS